VTKSKQKVPLVTQTIRFETSDGKLFDLEEEAREHELKLAVAPIVKRGNEHFVVAGRKKLLEILAEFEGKLLVDIDVDVLPPGAKIVTPITVVTALEEQVARLTARLKLINDIWGKCFPIEGEALEVVQNDTYSTMDYRGVVRDLYYAIERGIEPPDVDDVDTTAPKDEPWAGPWPPRNVHGQVINKKDWTPHMQRESNRRSQGFKGFR